MNGVVMGKLRLHGGAKTVIGDDDERVAERLLCRWVEPVGKRTWR